VGSTVRAGKSRALLTSLFLGLLVICFLAPSAQAANRVLAGSFGTEPGPLGGQIALGTGVVVNRTGAGGVPASSVYVPSFTNSRVDQFTATGDFIRAFGWDVVTSGGQHDVGTNAFEICEAVSTPADVCKAGGKVPDAGSVWGPEGITLDQATGNIFVADNNAKRIDVFSAKGTFEGAFGLGVDTGAAAFEFCTVASTCQAGLNSAAAGGLSNLTRSGLAIDPTNGNLFVGERGTRRINEFSFTLNGSNEVTGASFLGAFGWDVIPGGETGLETCTIASTCQAGVAGGGNGQFSTNTPTGLAVDSGGFLYAAASEGECNATTNPCRVQKFNPDNSFKEVFGPSSGGEAACQLSWASGPGAAQGPYGLAVDPTNQHVFVTRRASSTTVELCEFDSSGTLLDRSPEPKLETANGYQQPAVGLSGQIFVFTPVPGGGGKSAVRVLGTPPSPPDSTILPVTGVTATTATLHGEVTIPSPGGFGYDTSYRFEYSSNGINWSSAPVPNKAIGKAAGTYPVEQAIEGLQPNLTYSVRLVAVIPSGSKASNPATFTTLTEAPEVVSTSSTATQSEAVLSTLLRPNNLPTTYHFEWGTTTSYGKRVPAFERKVGSGGGVIAGLEELSGLSPETVYHYRVVASSHCNLSQPSEVCETVGLDRSFETPGANGLPGHRGIELVSPADKRPTGSVNFITVVQLYHQVSEDGESVGYPILNGLEASTAGGEPIFAAKRQSGGWSSSQVSASTLLPASIGSGNHFDAQSGSIKYFSRDLGCAVQSSRNPLTSDTPAAAVELSIPNLYRRNAGDGSYTLITNRVPSNLEEPSLIPEELNAYEVAGASDDCSRIFFRSPYLEFIAGSSGFYEWNDGVIRDAGLLPDGTVSTDNPARRVAEEFNTVSRGGRAFFTATSNEGPDAGKQAIFVRKSPTEVVDASQSVAGPAQGAAYETASPDGSHVFFRANYGIAPTSSIGPPEGICTTTTLGSGSEACDLYDYNVATEELTDISVTTDSANPKGAVVMGVLSVSEKGSVVYFAARGQLVAGQGRSYSENVSGGFANVYRYEAGDPLEFVGSLTNEDMTRSPGIDTSSLIHHTDIATSQASSEGDYLLFTSQDDMTGTNPEETEQAYLYSHQTGGIDCVSCPSDGSSPHVRSEAAGGGSAIQVSFSPSSVGNLLQRPRSLSDDGRVIFYSEDALAPGGIEGNGSSAGLLAGRQLTENNIYEWHDGQTSLVAKGRVSFVGMGGPNGRDLFVTTFDQLVETDFDFAGDLYDFRRGGGFAPPPQPSAPCDPAADRCQGAASTPPPASSPDSSEFNGPGNPVAKQPRPKCGKGKVRRHGKCVKKHRKKREKANLFGG